MLFRSFDVLDFDLASLDPEDFQRRYVTNLPVKRGFYERDHRLGVGVCEETAASAVGPGGNNCEIVVVKAMMKDLKLGGSRSSRAVVGQTPISR